MPELTFITLLIFVSIALLSSFITLHVDKLKRVIKRYTTLKRKPENKIEHQLAIHESAIINLTQKIVELEKQLETDKHNLNARIDRRVEKQLKDIIND